MIFSRIAMTCIRNLHFFWLPFYFVIVANPGVQAASEIGAECGVYAMASAAISLGVRVPRELIVDGEYVSGWQGSSIDDLTRFGARLGVWTRSLTGCSIQYVRNSSSPCVLRLSSDGQLRGPGHWIAYLGDEAGNAIVFDNSFPAKIRLVSYAELSMLMSGEIIIVDLSKRTFGSDFLHSMLTLCDCWWLPSMLFIPLAIFVRVCLISQNFSSPAFQVFWLLFLGFGVGLFCNCWSPLGFLNNRSTVTWVKSRHSLTAFREVSYEQFKELYADPRIIVVDARPTNAYLESHIPFAVSFPVDATPADLTQFLMAHDKKLTVFVYCATSKCKWADVVARRLASAGYDDVRIFRGGMQEFLMNP
jgi:rhodanese-related sulfurtransferase